MTYFLFGFLFLAMNINAASDLIAINVALTPEKKLDSVARQINQSTDGFHFDQTHYPHVTLVQGIVKKEDLPKVQKIISECKAQTFSLKSNGIENKEGLVNLNFEKNPELMKLEEKIASELSPYLQKNADKEAFYDPETVQSKDVDYAKTFISEKSGKYFEPHMTLGKGSSKKVTKPQDDTFSFTNIQLFQVGESGSARKKL